MKKLLSITILIAFATIMVTSCITTNINTEGDKSWNDDSWFHTYVTSSCTYKRTLGTNAQETFNNKTLHLKINNNDTSTTLFEITIHSINDTSHLYIEYFVFANDTGNHMVGYLSGNTVNSSDDTTYFKRNIDLIKSDNSISGFISMEYNSNGDFSNPVKDDRYKVYNMNFTNATQQS